MSNKRIDLTQFEGITPTQWRVDYEAVGDIKTVLYVKSDMTAHGNFVITVLEDAPNGEYTEADANAIAAVPDLIAELKRCYEEIDYLNALTNSLPIEMLVEADNKLQASE